MNVRERPLLMSGSLVRATLRDIDPKTQTRRPIRNLPPMPAANCHPNHKQRHASPYLDAYCSEWKTAENPRGMSDRWYWWQVDDRQCLPTIRCPYGKPGDRLWVRETWSHTGTGVWTIADAARANNDGHLIFRATDNMPGASWWPSIHMPRWASRITLEITDVRVQRLQDITEADAIAEGVTRSEGGMWLGGPHPECGPDYPKQFDTARRALADLWDSIYGERSPWARNDWVWAITYRRVQP